LLVGGSVDTGIRSRNSSAAANASPIDPALRRIDFEVLEKCARFFGVEPGALLEMVRE
jgi:hypothetical protein